MAYVDEVLADSPSAYWPLDNDQDDSANTNTLTFTGATAGSGAALITGDPAASTDFSGTTQYATAADHASLDPGDTFSFEFWVNADTFAQTAKVYSGGANGIAVALNTSGNIRCIKEDVALVTFSTVNLTAGVTYHTVWTKSGATNVLYVNAVDRTSTVTNQTVAANSSVKRIGANYSNGTAEEIDGRLGHVALYATALSSARVTAHYDAGIAAAGGVDLSHYITLLGCS